MNTREAGLKESLKKITYGFHIVTTRKKSDEMTTRDEDYIAAGTISWVSQCSFDPPMVLVVIQQHSDLHETIEKSRIFAINTLAKAEKPMASDFFKDTTVEENKLNGHPFTSEKTGAPILDKVASFIECEVEEEISTGDHTVFVGRVVNEKVRNSDAEPLIEWETDYHYGG